MGKDISTEYTKERNKECGRRIYYRWKKEKVTVISPRNYGEFIQRKLRKE